MSIPDWWEFALLLLAAYRTWRIVAEDDVFDQPRNWILGLPRTWKQGQAIPEGYREKWALFIVCPWCQGFYQCLLWWGAWQIWEHATLVMATPFALSSLVGFLRLNLDPPQE